MKNLRVDLSKQDLERYPQYFRDKYFVPDENGRFVRWDSIPVEIQKMLLELE